MFTTPTRLPTMRSKSTTAPKTFFDVIATNAARSKAETVVDWFDFLFGTYQHISREKLLEFLVGMPDRQELANQSPRDLAITYCERMAVHMHGQHAVRMRPHKVGS